MGQSESGTEMSIYKLVSHVETDAGLQMDKHQVHPLYFPKSHDETKLALYDSGI